MDICERFSMVAWTRPDASDRVLFTRLRCKQWSCDYCARKNQSVWRAFLFEKLPALSDNWWSLTITAHSQKRGMEQSYKNLQSGIDRLMKRVRRVWSGVEYVRIFEKHPTSDALHAHIIISGLTAFVSLRTNKNHTVSFTPCDERAARKGFWSISTFVKKACFGAGIGYQTEISTLRSHHAVYYSTKYLTKTAQEIPVAGIRHVQTTRGIGSPGDKSDYYWRVGSFITARDFQPGDTIYDMNLQRDIDSDWWNEHDIYPDPD